MTKRSTSFRRTYKLKWKPKNLYEVFLPVIWLNWIVGLGTIEIPCGRPRPTFTVIYILTFAIAYYYSFQKLTVAMSSWYTYEIIVFICIFTIQVTVATCSILLFWWHRKNFRAIVTRCAQVDDTLEELGVEMHYEHIYYQLLGLMIVWFICFITLCIVEIFVTVDDVKSALLLILHYLPVAVTSVVDFTFLAFLWCLKMQFEITNDLLYKTFTHASSSKKYSIRQETFVGMRERGVGMTLRYHVTKRCTILQLIATMRLVHLELYRISRQINDTFSIPSLLETGVHFGLITTLLYNLYFVMHSPKSSDFPKDMLEAALIMWCVFCSLKVIIVNHLCANISHKFQETGWIVQEYDGSFFNNDVKEEVRQFCLQILANPLRFTACGFFYLDNSFTCTFFGSVTTYLVLLIQMSSTPHALKVLNKIGAE